MSALLAVAYIFPLKSGVHLSEALPSEEDQKHIFVALSYLSALAGNCLIIRIPFAV